MQNLAQLKQVLMAFHVRLFGRENDYDWLPYLWLSYFLLYFVPLTRAALPGELMLAAWAAGIMAVVLYVLTIRQARFGVVLGLMVVGASVTVFYSGGVILLSYAATLMGFVPNKRGALGLVVIYASIALLLSLLVPLDNVFLILLWLSMLWGIGNTIHRRNEERTRILKLTQQDAQAIARLQERERIRGDLHDLLGQSLTTIALHMQVLERTQLTEQERLDIVKQTQQLARSALSQARATLHNNYQATLEEVIAHCRVSCLAKGVSFVVSQRSLVLSEAQNHALAQAVRESVTNTLRHSSATAIHVVFTIKNHRIELLISDNGGGLPSHLGTGLGSLKARVEELEGNVQFSVGWQTKISLPV